MSTIKRISIFVLALTVFFSGTAFTNASVDVRGCYKYYVVQNGDSLRKISHRYQIPVSTLADRNEIPAPWLIFPGQKICIVRGPARPYGQAMRIMATVRDTSVTIRVFNFTPNIQATVIMGAYGSKGVGGTVAATIQTGKSGTWQGVYTIPAGLKGANQIDVRVQGATAAQFIYRSFNNITSAAAGYSDTPYFELKSVVKNTSVTVQALNLPAGVAFEVLMTPVSWQTSLTTVGTWSTGVGGSQTATYAIPVGLQTNRSLMLVVRNLTLGIVGYVRFGSATTP
jgi:hypothetical protein